MKDILAYTHASELWVYIEVRRFLLAGRIESLVYSPLLLAI